MHDYSDSSFDVLTDAMTYRRWLYLLSNYILGVLYFVFLVTGFSVGFGLSFVLIGIPLLIFMFPEGKGFNFMSILKEF